MIHIAAAQWHGWVAAFLYPLLRVLGLILADPLLGNRSVPLTARLGLALLVTLLLVPLLPPAPVAEPASAAGVLVAVQQLLIGLAMGFSMRIAFSAAQMAGELAGLQASFGFGQLFDPHNAPQTSIVGRFFGLFAVLIFFSIDGHHVVLSALSASFGALPIAAPIDTLGLRVLVDWAAIVFSAGLLIALPVLATLLIANIGLGILTRAAPPLNAFTAGFPIMLLTGLVVLYLVMPAVGTALANLFEQATLALGRVLEALAP